MRKATHFFLVLIFFAASPVLGQPVVVDSPGGVLRVSVELQDGVPQYTVHRFGRTIIEPSALGFEFQNMPALRGGFRLAGSEQLLVDETWTQVWGEQEEIRDHHRSL
jgi:hypothetical protein